MKTNHIIDKKQLTEALENVDAVSLNGKSFSDPMSKAEYDAIENKDPTILYLVNDDSTITGVPDYSTSDANKVLAVNSDGTALAWIDAPSGNGTGLTQEQITQLQAAYEHSQTVHVSSNDIPTKISQLENDSNFVTRDEMNAAINISSDVIVTSEEGNKYKLVINETDGTLSAVKIEDTPINIVVDKSSISIKVDESETLTATITPSNATDKTVTWETNNANVSLIPNGLNCTVKGVTEGSSIVTVTTNDGNHTATSNVTITTKEPSGGDQPAGVLDASCISYNESYTTYDGNNTFTFKAGLPSWNGLSAHIDSGVFEPSTQYTIYCQLLEEELPDDANNKVCTWGVDSHYSETGRITEPGLHSTMKSITFTTKNDITPTGKNFIFLQFTNQLIGYIKVKFYINKD